MNTDLIFRIILGIIFVIVIVTRRYFERKSAAKANEGLIQDKDSNTQIALQSFLLTVSNLGMIVYLINPKWMMWSIMGFPSWVGWVGAVIGALGCATLMWTHQTLGENFFGGVKIREDHKLITGGPYRWVRHPMYTAFLLLGFAWLFLSGNWFISGLWLAASILVIINRLDTEEKMMLQQFGEAYQVYSNRSGRLLPKFWSKVSKPDQDK